MSDDRRFALLKLTREGHARNLEAALREFGLINGIVHVTEQQRAQP
jgi:hypothetical protein